MGYGCCSIPLIPCFPCSLPTVRLLWSLRRVQLKIFCKSVESFQQNFGADGWKPVITSFNGDFEQNFSWKCRLKWKWYNSSSFIAMIFIKPLANSDCVWIDLATHTNTGQYHSTWTTCIVKFCFFGKNPSGPFIHITWYHSNCLKTSKGAPSRGF